MLNKSTSMKEPQKHSEEYRQLGDALAQVSWVAIGSLVERGEPGQGGPRYQWSRREKGKTVTVALSREQFEWMQMAIANQRKAEEILGRMQKLSLVHLWENLPSTTRRKQLSKRTLGLK